MANHADRVQETTETTGTGTYSLAGAVDGAQTFVAGIGDGNTCRYLATDGIDWEIGVGTITDADPDTLSRDSINASSNGDSAVNWGSGEKQIAHVMAAADFADFARKSEANSFSGAVSSSQVKALDSNGLQLTDDAGNGLTVHDGGQVVFDGPSTRIGSTSLSSSAVLQFRNDTRQWDLYSQSADFFGFYDRDRSVYPLKIDGPTGDIIVDSGLYLGGTAAANLLDDYEEGPWTPVLEGDSTAGDFSYSSQAGYYTKVGNFVYLEFRLEVSAVNSAADGNMFISDIPFNPASTVQNVVSFAPATQLDSYPTDYSGLVGRVWSDGSGIQLGYFKKESATEFNLDDAHVGTSTKLRGAAWYRV